MYRGEVLNGLHVARVAGLAGPSFHFVHSKVMCWAGMNAAARRPTAWPSDCHWLGSRLLILIILLGAPGSLVGTVELDEKAGHMTFPLTLPTRGAIRKRVITVDRMPLGQLS
jgi:hypothetical protein